MTDTFDDFSLLLPHMRKSLTVSLVFSACDYRIAKNGLSLAFESVRAQIKLTTLVYVP
jgi:hypothetical protein